MAKNAQVKKNLITLLKIIVCLVFWIALWEIIALLINKAVVLPTPKATIKRLFELFGEDKFYGAIWNSLYKIFVGFVIGLLAGTILAILSSLGLEFLLSPAVTVVKSTPVASIIIVMLYMLGREKVPTVVTVMMVIPVIYQNILKGISAVGKEKLEVAKVFSFGIMKKIKLCYFPSIKPFANSGIKTSIGLAWKAGIAAEVICTPKISIGTMLYDAKIYLESEDLFAWTLCIIVLSLILENVLSFLLDILTGGNKK
ncbi:MAG: ABC transporter permease subunit [Clostridia bacterium]|nr:ABC transporter permease subunit [Clostridia bacterium]